MSLTRVLIVEAKLEALSLLVRRIIVDQVLRQAHPVKALRSLRAAADELGDNADHGRQQALMASNKRAVTAAEALSSLVDEIGRDVREEVIERQQPAA